LRRAIEFRRRAVGAQRGADRPRAAATASLDEHRQATLAGASGFTPRELNEVGGRSGHRGRLAGDYWQVAGAGRARPVLPTSGRDEALRPALASYGRSRMFHMIGITPEAQRLDDAVPGGGLARMTWREADVRAFQAGYAKAIDSVVWWCSGAAAQA